MKAFSYLRVSGKEQVLGDGFPRQREVIAKRAQQYGAEIVSEFRDEGVSGTKDFDDRPGLTDLLLALDANPDIKTVFVEDSRRLARELMVQELVIAEFRKRDVKLISAESDIDLTVGDDDPTKKLIRQILGAISEWDKSTLVLKLRKARQRKKKETGRCEGRKPFGSKPGEQETLDRMVELRSRGFSYKEIAAVLTNENRPSRFGGRWTVSRVHAICSRASITTGA